MAVAVSVFKDIIIFDYSIRDILVILLIIFIGFKNGIGIGAISGLAIGTSLTLIDNIEVLQILIFISSGIISGILSHIVMPEKFRKISFVQDNLLGNSGEHRLTYYEEIKEKINAVTQTIADMNNNFFIKNNDSTDTLNKEVYIENFLDLMENYTENIFYDDLINNENLIGDFFDCLVREDIITEKEMLEIFRKYNNYILLRDQKLKEDLQEIIKISNRTYRELQINSIKVKVKKEEAQKLENELKNVTNMINSITENDNNTLQFENKEKEIFTLLKGKMYPIKNVKVSRCKNGKYIVKLSLEYKDDSIREKNKIANIESLISRSLEVKVSFQKDKKNLSTGEYLQVYSADDKYALQVGSTKISKDGDGKVSGDTSLQVRLGDGKYLLAISDGMGSGEKARNASKFVINNLNNLMSKGFEQDETIKLINSELNFNKDSEMYASLDMSILDLYSGIALFSKNGACNTYIKNKKNVRVYKGESLPVGIVDDAGLSISEVELNEGDIILMCSDGLLENSYGIKENWIESFLSNVNTNNVQKIADLITSEAIDHSFGTPKDDITVIVAKIIKKK